MALGVSEQAVRQAIARGTLAAGKRGRAYRIRRDELDRYAQRQMGLRPAQPRGKLVALPIPGPGPTLPMPATRFVGRVVELATLVALLEDPAERVITVIGPGGIGKTRLALAAAAAVRDHFPDGVHFVDLAPLSQPQLAVPTIAQNVGLREQTGQDRRAQLAAFLRGKHVLLVLDNVEQILAAGPDLAWVVDRAPELSVLVTSRAPLRIGGERVLVVPPLALAGVAATPDEVLASDAGRLFVERARGHDPGSVIDAESAPYIADICSRLDGLPLAIELAAARSRLLPPRQLRDRLERRLPLLTHGARDAPARQRTMRDAIAWSYELLREEEQRCFRRLAIFAGGCTFDAAAAVLRSDAAGHEAETVDALLDLIEALVERSLLTRELGPRGDLRFRMLETIREFGLERLDAGEEARLRAAHAAYFLRFAQTLRLLANTRSTREPHDCLAADDANLRAALAWLDERGLTADLARLVAATYASWYWRGDSQVQDLDTWLARALGKDGQASATTRAQLMVGLASLLLWRGESSRANPVFVEAIALLRGIDDPVNLAMALNAYGASLNHDGRYADAESQLGEGLSLAEASTDAKLQAAVVGNVLSNLSDSARGQGDLDLARARSEGALRRYRGQNLELGETRALIDLANIARDQGDYRLALEYYLACLNHASEQGEWRLVADNLAGIASAVVTWGQTRTALQLFGAGAALRERIGIGVNFPADTARVDHDVTALRAAFGARQVDALLAEGRALSASAAVALAMSVAPSSSGSPADRAESSSPLTRREREILGLLSESLTDREIAERLFLSPHTVSWHVRSILTKLGVATRREAVAHARADGLHSP